MQEIEIGSIYSGGIRVDINEKFIGNNYFVNVDRFNFDSIVGMDKILERDKVNTSEYVSSKGVDGIFEYRYRDESNEEVKKDILVTGGSVISDKDSPSTLLSGIQQGLVDFAVHLDKLYIATKDNYPYIYWGRKGIVYQMGAPAVEDSGVAGNPSGTYYYAMTYITDGGEEVLGTISNTITVSSKKITVNTPVGYSGTLQRKLYRTTDGGSDLKFLYTIPDNTTLSYTDNTSDADLNLGTDLSNSLTAQWRFNESSGTTAADQRTSHPVILSAAAWTTGLLNNAMQINSTNQSAASVVSDDFSVATGDDFTLCGWVKTGTSSFADGINVGTSRGWQAIVGALFIYIQDKSSNTGIPKIGVGGTSGEGSSALSASTFYYFWVKRTAGVVEAGWSAESESFSSTPKVTFTDASALIGTQMIFEQYQTDNTETYLCDQWTFKNGEALSDTALETLFNGGAGTENNYNGAEIIPETNNECPKPQFLQVQYSRLAACGTSRNSNQLFVTDTLIEMIDSANSVDISGQSNDNTALAGISQDYVNTIVFSAKNVFMVDLSATPVTSKVTRANIGCQNGYTVKKIPAYKDFEGGVFFLSTLNDFRLFNSNFAQPIISMTLSDEIVDESWSRAVDPIISNNTESIKQAYFYDYKYHISFGDMILVFDIRNRGWTKMTEQDCNCFGELDGFLYCGRTATSYLDKMYAKETIDGSTEFNATIESGAVGASDVPTMWGDLIFYYSLSGYNKLSLEITYEDDFKNIISETIHLRDAGEQDYDPQFFDDKYYNVTAGKDSYLVYHMNRLARWFKWKLVSQEGRFLYRGYKANGSRTGEKQYQK